MNETTYIYICHSDINENNIYAEFATEEEAIDYAMRHADELTYVDKVEVVLDDEGEVIEVFDSETIWVYDELTPNTENKFVTSNDEVECQSCGNVVDAKNCRRTDGGYYVCNHCIDEDFDSLVETLEENEDVVECKECFELFPKDSCIKLKVGYMCPECGKIHHHKGLDEQTHAQYAKPEGDRKAAYNNALTYAKKNNADYIYGYTNHTGKFFALEQPIKMSEVAGETEKEFKNKYKNCSTVFVAYRDKGFIREGLFTKAEQEEYNMDENGNSLDSYDTYVRCNWCKEVYTEYECKFEANLGWLCPSCQEEIRYHGGPLTIIENPTEEQIKSSLEESVEENTAFGSKPEDWVGNIAWGYFNYWKYRGSYTTVEDFIEWCSQEENPHVDLIAGLEIISKASPEVQKAVFKLIKERLTKVCEKEVNDVVSRYNYAQKTLTKALTDLLIYFKSKNNSVE